ncbi:ester cyclase [Kitasatospora sp. NPDC048365]|uniref:ester cyclase n=1 Tax=Kitasatospora sp. NPDC048365 TaxID=3364050 RepID=UPI003724678F
MTFVQIVECRTDQVDALNSLMDTWVEQTQGRRTATHSIVGTDRDNMRHVVEIVEFPSYEEAMRNSDLPETDRIFREMVALCDEPPTFTNLDVVRDEQLNKELAMRFFAVANGPDDVMIDSFVAADYHDHDPGAPMQSQSREDLKRQMEMWRGAFDFTMNVEDMMAEGDQVCCRWSLRGKHTGEFMGLPATDKVVEVTGTTMMRFKDGMLAESWWQWDNAGMLRQLGLIKM